MPNSPTSRHFGALLAFAALLPSAGEVPAPPRELLRNGDFTRAGAAGAPPADWLLSGGRLLPAAEAATDADASGVALTAGASPTAARLRQAIERPPRGPGRALLTGRVRLVHPGSGGAGSARLGLAFLPAGSGRDIAAPLPATADSYHSAPARRDGVWTELHVDVPAPDTAGPWQVWCEVPGDAVAQFADVSLLFEGTRTPLVPAALAVATGAWILEAVDGPRTAPWIDVSVPVPHGAPGSGGQAPLVTRVLSDPPGAVARLELLDADGHVPLRIHLRDLAHHEVVTLRAETLVLLDRGKAADGRGVRLPTAITPRDGAAERERAFQRLPADGRAFVMPAPGIEPDSDGARQAATPLRRRDVAALAGDLAQLLEYKFSHSGDGEDRSRVDGWLGMAQAAGRANAAVALLLCHGVPARLLACLPIGATLQEHYLVELWAPGLGWARLDPSGTFPAPPARHVVLRVVRPGDPRTPENVPLFLRASEGLMAHFDMDPILHAWQSCHERGTSALEPRDLQALLDAVRDGFRGDGPDATDRTAGDHRVWIPPSALAALPVARAPGLHAALRASLAP